LAVLIAVGDVSIARAETPRAPTLPPLSAPSHSSRTLPVFGGDALSQNGLLSPGCVAGVSTALRAQCVASGSSALRAPIDAYGLDLPTERNLLGIEEPSALGLLQSLVVQPLWLAIVWAFRALVTMLEWAFSIDLVRSGKAVVSSLSETDRLGLAWLPVALAICSAALAYRGIVQRRVGAALSAGVLTACCVVAGLGLADDPGIVSQAAELSDQTAQEILAGSTGRGARAVEMFAPLAEAAIEEPWCYLEFGDVKWCLSAPSAPLRDAAAALHPGGTAIRGARNVASLFFRFPAESTARTDIESPGSLLRALCRGEELSACRGPDAARVRFMTTAGTWSRVGGLVLIVSGDLGVLLLLGTIGIRVIVAAATALLLLALAPVVVVIAASGDRGRSVFRTWLARLFGAIVTKVVAALLLGLVLAVLDAMWHVGSGFWVAWILASALAWGLFLGRNEFGRVLGGVYANPADALVPRLGASARRTGTFLAGAVGAAGTAEVEAGLPRLSAPRIVAPTVSPVAASRASSVPGPSVAADRLSPKQPGQAESVKEALRKAQSAHETRTGETWGNAHRVRELARLAGLDREVTDRDKA